MSVVDSQGSQTSGSASAVALPELQAALLAQRRPLEHVESAFGQGWALIGQELEEARRLGEQPGEAWRKSFQLLKGLRGEAVNGQSPQLVVVYRQALELHEKGLARLADDPFSDHGQYLARMGEHFRPQVERMREVEGQCLEVSAVVGAEAMGAGSERLAQMDQTMSLLGMALASVVGRGNDYLSKLNGPEIVRSRELAEEPAVQPLAFAPAALADPSARTALIVAGPREHTVAGFKSFYREAYGVDMEFAADLQPLFAPIEGPVRGTMPEQGLGYDQDLSLSL